MKDRLKNIWFDNHDDAAVMHMESDITDTPIFSTTTVLKKTKVSTQEFSNADLLLMLYSIHQYLAITTFLGKASLWQFSRFRHKKTGNIYIKMYESTTATNCRDGEPTIIYCNLSGQIFNREASEFFDKFEKI